MMDERNKYGLSLILPAMILLAVFSILIPVSCENSLLEAIEKDIDAAGPASTFHVIYDGNGNTGGEVPVDLTEYKSGDTVTVLTNKDNLVRDGYTYLYWNTKADYTGEDYTDGLILTITDSDITLYARWSPNSNTVVFNDNGGVGTMADQTIKSDTTADLLPNAFTMADHTFAGWSTYASDCAVAYRSSDVGFRVVRP